MKIVLGVDEVGRGCWAGPLVVGAVILRTIPAGLRDSKKLSKAGRTMLEPQIYANSTATSLGWVSVEEIDELGLTKATSLAIERALEPVTAYYDQIVIDGKFNFLPAHPKAVAMVNADDKVPSVSAASIIAKVARDEFMIKSSKYFPGYGFEKHVGYGTTLHLDSLKKLGASKLHRLSYKPIKQFIV